VNPYRSTTNRLRQALLALVVACVVVPAGAGYLRSIGPVPLRWQPQPVPHPEVLQTLPPLVIEPEPAATSSHDAAHATPATKPLDLAGLGAESGNAGTNRIPSALSPAGGENVILPGQPLPAELLNTLFYSPGGTNRPAKIVMPLNFMPPPMMAPRSSTATYSTDAP
jgi:hypothetical protein